MSSCPRIVSDTRFKLFARPGTPEWKGAKKIRAALCEVLGALGYGRCGPNKSSTNMVHYGKLGYKSFSMGCFLSLLHGSVPKTFSMGLSPWLLQWASPWTCPWGHIADHSCTWETCPHGVAMGPGDRPHGESHGDGPMVIARGSLVLANTCPGRMNSSEVCPRWKTKWTRHRTCKISLPRIFHEI